MASILSAASQALSGNKPPTQAKPAAPSALSVASNAMGTRAAPTKPSVISSAAQAFRPKPAATPGVATPMGTGVFTAVTQPLKNAAQKISGVATSVIKPQGSIPTKTRSAFLPPPPVPTAAHFLSSPPEPAFQSASPSQKTFSDSPIAAVSTATEEVAQEAKTPLWKYILGGLGIGGALIFLGRKLK